MYILPLVGYTGLLLGFAFLTLAIASGLYYLSDLVEEYSVFSKRLLHRLIYAIIAIHALLWAVDSFPFRLSALAVISHVVYLQNLRFFPIVRLSDPYLLVSLVLVAVNHWLFFSHFQRPPRTPSAAHEYYNRYDPAMDPTRMPDFQDIAGFFGICVWLVPFMLFISLSAGESILPTSLDVGAGSIGSSDGMMGSTATSFPGAVERRKKGMGGMAKQAIDGVRDYISESWQLIRGGSGSGRFKRY